MLLYIVMPPYANEYVDELVSIMFQTVLFVQDKLRDGT